MGCRELIERAVAAGRAWQQPQTGYVHYCYHPKGEKVHYPIPVVENFLFALALLRTKSAENVMEARELIAKLLSFQNEGFPIYLHQYPVCFDRWIGASLLPIFHWILQDFSKVLGEELRGKLEASSKSLKHWSLVMQREKTPPYSIAVLLAACIDPQLLAPLADKGEQPEWSCPDEIGRIFTGLQIAYPKITESPWKPFLSHVLKDYDPVTASYAGPALCDVQEGFEPQVALYDSFLGLLSGVWPERVKSLHPRALQAALVRDFSEEIAIPAKEGKTSFAFLPAENAYDPNGEKNISFLRWIWGSPNRLHSFVCQGGTRTRLSKEGELFLFDLPAPEELDDRKKNRDIRFFMDFHDDLKISVEGRGSTTFRFGEQILLEDHQVKISLRFDLIQGEGEFLGHIMRGNRPSQAAVNGEERFEAYDWHLFLRTVERDQPCRVGVTVTVEEK